MEMKELSANLMGLINDEIVAYGSLLQILKEEKCIIALCDYKRLIETSKKKEAEIYNIKSLEDDIQILNEQMMVKIGCPITGQSMEDIFRLFEAPYQQRLNTLWINLKRIAGEVQEMNSKNKRLLENVLNLIKDSFSLLSNMAAPSPIYYRTGRLNNAPVSGNLINGSI